jgi:site-specific DNA-methyltransferase (adenine-specific)
MTRLKSDVKEKSKLSKEEWRDYTKTVWQIANVSHSDHPAVFPVEIPNRLIKLFSFWGDTVLDPFAGVGTTARAALNLGRKAICVDQNPTYISIIEKECARVKRRRDLTVVLGDCRCMEFIVDGSIDLIVTSPPYWNKADYGNNNSNLGSIHGYQQFLNEIKPAFAECFRVLEPGRKLCIVTAHVNQHTDHGLLTFPLSTDFTNLLRHLGFVMVNQIIWSKDGTGGKWGSYGRQRPIFGSYPYPPNFHFKNVHEYILIFAKPSSKKTTGPKVMVYEHLMQLSVNGEKEESNSRSCVTRNGVQESSRG